MTSTPEPPESPRPARRSIRSHAIGAVDKLPTKWIGLAVVAVFLAVSAAFGGLAEAPVKPPPQLEAGDSVTGAQLRIAVDRIELVDSLPDQFIEPDVGNRLLIVVATVENVFDKPVSTYASIGAADNLRPVGVRGIDTDTDPLAVTIVSDGTQGAQLQPGVPVQLAYAWEVADNAVSDGDDLRVDVFDKIYAATGFVTYGERFDNPFLCAFVTLPVDDLGSGGAL